MPPWVIPEGYRFAGVVSHLRSEPDRRDLALIVSDRPAACVGVFTQNRITAAPVQLCRQRLPRSDARGVVICSGNANACTGEQGYRDACRMAELTAEQIGCSAEQILVASTGVIGRRLPMEILEAGIPQAAARLAHSPDGVNDAAHAILTTDTVIKVASRVVDHGVHLLGMAKGAAMIGPNLATMLAFLMTDASVLPADLQAILRRAVDRSFNRISVEGHTSTNDTVLLFANGTGPHWKGPALNNFAAVVEEVCIELAKAIARDAEGANHLMTFHVEGCRDEADAVKIAKTVSESALVKTAIYGGDPNWGRIVSAAGYSGVTFDETELSLWLGDVLLYRQGNPMPFDAAAMSAYLKNHREVTIRLKLNQGSGQCTFWSCDLTPEYVRLNGDYTT